MKLDFAAERVLAVMAHPDDAELLCAGALARAKGSGAAIGICIMCNGDKGRPTADSHTNLSEIRKSEAQSAAALLPANFFWFNCPDGALFDTTDTRRQLIEIYRQFKPTLVITHAPQDYHPDHRAASALAEAATWFAASTGHVTPSPALPAAPALWYADTLDMIDFTPDFYVDISPHLDLKQRMLACHQSQLQRAGDANFAPLADLLTRQATTRGQQSGVSAAEAFRQHHAFKRLRAW